MRAYLADIVLRGLGDCESFENLDFLDGCRDNLKDVVISTVRQGSNHLILLMERGYCSEGAR